MARRKVPDPADVAAALDQLRAVGLRMAARERKQQVDRAKRDQLIAEAVRHDPQPTNRQVAEAAGVSESYVRKITT